MCFVSAVSGVRKGDLGGGTWCLCLKYCAPSPSFQDDHGTLRYLDTSIGQPVAEIRTKLGALKSLAQNPRNAIVQLGHFNGCVTLWSPNVPSPLAKLQCHRGPVTCLAVDQGGHNLVTAAMDARMKVRGVGCRVMLLATSVPLQVWDVRTFRPLQTYVMRRPIVSMDISGRGLLAVGWGQQVEVWRDAFSQKQTAPYLTHKCVHRYYIMGCMCVFDVSCSFPVLQSIWRGQCFAVLSI